MHGDAQAFEEIHATFRPRIHRYLLRLVGEQEAEDLTQEAFLKVSRGLANFRGEAQLSTWLYRIATHTALDRLRSPAFRRDREESLPVSALEACESNCEAKAAWTGERPLSAEQQVVRDEMSQCIAGFVQGLADHYRAVLVLSELEGLGDKEIANILGISLGSVKIRLHRAREKLKEALLTRCETYWLEDNEFVPELIIEP